MRIRINFAKTEAMRYTSHLDLHRTLERTIRRAALPLAYSQGFRPHPRINLACALPLGFTSESEVVDIWLESELPLDSIRTALSSASPPGIVINSIEQVPLDLPALQSSLLAAEYHITFLCPMPELGRRIENVLESTSLPRIRRGKPYDLRPLINELKLLPGDTKPLHSILVKLSAMEGATGRPEEVILALGGNPHEARVHRVQLIFNLAQP
jgi:radical SAM-linked protein